MKNLYQTWTIGGSGYAVLGVGSVCSLWNSSLVETYSRGAWYLAFNSDYMIVDYSNRNCGLAVRPVKNIN